MGTPISNTAEVSWQEPGGTTYFAASNEVTTQVAPGYQLDLQKAVNAIVGLPGDTLVFTLTARNSGNVDMAVLTVTDTLSPWLQFISASEGATVTGNIITWNVPNLLWGQSIPLILTCRIDTAAVYGQGIRNAAAYQMPDSVMGTSNEVFITVGLAPAMVFEKSVDKLTAFPGDTLTYTLTARNTGNAPSTNTLIHDDMPDFTIYDSASNTHQVNFGIVTWNENTLAPGSEVTETLRVVLFESIPPRMEILNVAHVTTAENVHAFGTALTHIYPSGNPLSFSKLAVRSTYSGLDTIRYRLVIRNSASYPIHDVVVTDSLPSLLEFISASHNGVLENGVVSWHFGLLPAFVVDTLRLRVRPIEPVTVTTPVINIGEAVSSDGGTSQSSYQILLIPPANPLTLLKTVEQPEVGPQDTIRYRLIVGNSADIPIQDIMVADTLPQLLEFVSASDGGIHSNGVVQWNLAELGPNQSDTLLLSARISTLPDADTTVINSAAAQSSLGGSAQSSCPVMITLPPNPLTLVKTATQTQVAVNDTIRFSLMVGNTADFTITDITVTDTLPELLAFISASHGGVYSDGLVHWNLNTLAPNEIDTLTLATRLQSSILEDSTVVNTALAQSSDGGNATASRSILITSAPLLEAVKSAPASILPWDTLRYTMTVANTGSGTATQVSMTDSLPAGLELLTATPGYVYDDANHTIGWTIPELLPDSILTLTVATRVADSVVVMTTPVNRFAVTTHEGISAADTAGTYIHPFFISVTADPGELIGNGEDTTRVTAYVTDPFGNPAIDGLPVILSTTAGSFAAPSDTVLLVNGQATIPLVSARIDNAELTAIVRGKAGNQRIGYVTDTTSVRFLAGGLYGTIHTLSGETVAGAAIQVTRMSTGQLVGTDTTSTDGQYLFPIAFSDEYQTLAWQTSLSGAQRKIIDQVIPIVLPSAGSIEAVPNRNSISGRLVDSRSHASLDAEGLLVVLTTDSARNAQASVLDSAYTDTSGRFLFGGLEPGTYRLEAHYNGPDQYHNGTLTVTLPTAGYHLIDADIPLEQALFYSFKTVDKVQAVAGDSLTYTIIFGSIQHAVTDTIFISDELPAELTFIESSFNPVGPTTLDYYDPALNTIRFMRPGLAALQTDTISFQAFVKPDLAPGLTTVANTALVYCKQDSSSTADDSRSRATARLLSPFIVVTKSVYPKIAEIGDVLTYTITVKNKSQITPFYDVSVIDMLPRGLKFKRHSTVWKAARHREDPELGHLKSQMEMRWAFPDTLGPLAEAVLTYRTYIGLDTRFGENDNRVFATAEAGDDVSMASPEARATVLIRPGILSNRGLIIGKVYFDTNLNGIQDADEATLPGVELVSETGIRVITDEFGKYSIPNVTPGDHVLRLNEQTLPAGVKILLNSVDFLGDSRSRLVHVPHGGIAKANFSLQGTETIGVSLLNRQTDSTTVTYSRKFLNNDLRMIIFKPWKLTLRLHYQSISYLIEDTDKEVLSRIGHFLQWQPEITLDIAGHTDNFPIPAGSPIKSNLDLSRQRAEQIKKTLTEEYKIDPKRITANGKGDSEPLEANSTPEGRALNRRVELVFHTPYEADRIDRYLHLEAHFAYGGGMPVSTVNYSVALPEGLKYSPASSKINNEAVEPAVSDRLVTWPMGDWSEPLKRQLDYDLMVVDYHSIKSTSHSTANLSFYTAPDSLVVLDTLMADIRSNVEEVYFRIMMAGTNFAVNSATLNPSARDALNSLGEFLNWQKSITIKIQGFTDDQGALDKNMVLSEARAQSVKDFLVRNFAVDQDRILTEGFGPQFAIADNSTRTGRAQNRRVEVLALSDFRQKVSLQTISIQDSVSRKLGKSRVLRFKAGEPKELTAKPGSILNLELGLDWSRLPGTDQVRLALDIPAGWAVLDKAGKESTEPTYSTVIPVETGSTVVKAILRLKIPAKADVEAQLRLNVRAFMKKIPIGVPAVETIKVTLR